MSVGNSLRKKSRYSDSFVLDSPNCAMNLFGVCVSLAFNGVYAKVVLVGFKWLCLGTPVIR